MGVQPTHRICKECDRTLPIEQFHKCGRGRRRSRCGQCVCRRTSTNQASYVMGWRYQVTTEKYAEMLEVQDGRCGICNRLPVNDRRLSIDHDHACCPSRKTCGKCVRGLLCPPCNAFLGFYENADRRTAVEAYLSAAGHGKATRYPDKIRECDYADSPDS